MKKKFKINFHIVFFIIVICIIALVLFRLSKWNARNVEIDTDVDFEEFAMECQDYYVYNEVPSPIDNGKEDILIIGNSILSNPDDLDSISSMLRKRLDANFYFLIADNSKITSDYVFEYNPASANDSFSLYRVTQAIVNKEVEHISDSIYYYPASIFDYDSDIRSTEYLEQLNNIDLNSIDTVIIMYSLVDYYNSVITLTEPNEAENGYYGALYSSIKLLQDTYPHLNLILSSPVPGYVLNEDGSVGLSSQIDYGFGNASAYIDMQYFVATKLCISYIDNYFYTINESNITEYLDGFYLSPKGRNLVANHMIQFLVDNRKIPEK